MKYSPIFLQKAVKLDLNKHAKDLPGRWIQKKIDGVGCQAIFNPCEGPELFAMTKAKVSGKFTNFSEKIPHIIYELCKCGFDGILQGELYADHLPTCHENFGFTTGTLHADDAIKRQISGKLKFVVYDMPSHPGPYKERYAALDDLFKQFPKCEYISLITMLDVNYENSWESVFDSEVAAGGEGIIMYDANALYKHSEKTNQRNRGVLKVKAEDEKEVLCVEMWPGEGKYAGTLGAMICIDGEGRTFHIGSFAISDEERQHLWDNMRLPLVVEMTYYQATPESYKLPRMTRARPDKDSGSWNKDDSTCFPNIN